MDERDMVAQEDFNVNRYDFVEASLESEPHENYDDVIEHKIFKYKYRVAHDDQKKYERRNDRMMNRFYDRARNRDPLLE